MNRYTQGDDKRKNKRKFHASGSPATSGATPVDATGGSGSSGSVGGGAWSSLGSGSSFTTSNTPTTQLDSRGISPATDSASGVARFGNQNFHATGSPGTTSQSTVAAEPQFHASGSPGTTSQSAIRTQPEFHATGSAGTTARTHPDGRPERMMHATGSPMTEPTPQNIDAAAKQLGISPLQIRTMLEQGGTSNLTGFGGATLQAQATADGSPLQQQALQEAARQAREGGSPLQQRALEEQLKLAEASKLSPLQQQHVEEREQAKPPEERVNLDEFFKSAELVESLSPSDQAEAQRILKEEGQNAFATYVSSRSVEGGSGGIEVNADTVQSLNDAKTAFAQGGYDDFFKAHDQFQVLSDPNTSDQDKANARAAMDDILANPSDRGAIVVKSDAFATGNESLDKALSIVASSGTSGTINEADLEGLDDETQAVVRNVTNKIKLRADAAGQNFDEAKRRALQGELVGDLGSGTISGIALPPDSWSNIQKAGHWLNQALSNARNGNIRSGWKDHILFAFKDANLSGDDAWSRVQAAFDKYTADRTQAVSNAVGDPTNSVSINEDEEGGTSLSGFIDNKRKALTEESQQEDAEIAKNKGVLESLDTLLSGGQVSEEALASLPPEMTDRVRNIQVKSREHEIARRESALLQKFDQFEEGERQRISALTERRRLQQTAPSLTQDVAGEFQPPGTMDRVASVEEKIDRGGQLTGQDLIGLPADQQRRLQDRSTSAINRLTDVEQANAEIQLEARRRMLDPFTAAGGASIYGQGNAHQTFGRNVMSGVEQRIAQTLNDITISADRERAGRKEAINSQYDQAIHKLSRIFATSPDKLSGAAQRRFEELEAERSNALTGVDVEVDRAVRDEQRTNIELLTGLQESREAAALGAEELNLNALGQAAGFAGGLDDRALREAEVYGRGDKGETLSGEIQRGQLGLSERDSALREAEVYGGTEGVGMGDLTALGVSAILDNDGNVLPGISIDVMQNAVSQVEENFRNRFGRDATPGEKAAILRGESVGGRETLGAELGRGQLAETATERAERQRLDRDRFGLSQTELYGQDISGMSPMQIQALGGTLGARDTAADRALDRDRFGLEGEISRGQLAETVDARTEAQRLDRDQFGLEEEISRGQLAETIDARTEAQRLDRDRFGLEGEISRGQLSLERAELFGGEDSINLSQIGDFGADAILNPDGSLAVNRETFMDASARISEGFNQKYGRSPSASEMTRIMQGDEVGGRSTLAASEAQADRRLQSELATGKVTIDGKRQQTLQDFIERGELTNQTSALFADQLGYVNDPNYPFGRIQTLAGKAHDLQDEQFTESTRQFNAAFFGDMIDPETGDVREGLDSQQVATQIAQFNRQMANTERELTANIGQTWASITGDTGTPSPVSADDFGVDVSNMRDINPMAWRGTDEYNRVSEGIQSMTGQQATDEQIMSILSGQDAMIDGAPTMEARELSTRVVQANMDRAVQVNQFAKEIGLSRDQFEQVEETADREWQMTTQDVAGIYGLEQEDWAQARSIYERALSRGESHEEASAQAAGYSGLSSSEFMQANNMFEERWGQKSRAAAIEMGLTQDQWEQTKAAQKEMTDRENRYWDGIMENVGHEVNLSSLSSIVAVPKVGQRGLTQELSDQIDSNVLSLIAAYKTPGSRLAGANTTAEQKGLRDFILANPDTAHETFYAIQRMDEGTGQIQYAVEKFGVTKAVASMLIESGVGTDDSNWQPLKDIATGAHGQKPSVTAIAQMRDNFRMDGTLWEGYEQPDTSALEDPAKIAQILEDRYDITPDKAAEHAQSIFDGESMMLPPTDWLGSMDPVLRQEVLSLIHGGTTFGIAQQEPSLGETIGGFAGVVGGQFMGGAGAALFDKMFGG